MKMRGLWHCVLAPANGFDRLESQDEFAKRFKLRKKLHLMVRCMVAIGRFSAHSEFKLFPSLLPEEAVFVSRTFP